MNFLHNLQLKLSFHTLICLLNDARVLMVLKLSERLFQSLHPKKDKLSMPQLVVSILAINIGKLFLRLRLHGSGSMWNRTRTVRIGLAFTRELMELFHTEPLAVPELVHLESRSRTDPNQKVLV